MDTTCLGAALLPHPPIMLPEIGGDELRKIDATVRAVQAAARLIISQKPETLVIMSPHNYVFPDGATLVETPRLYGNLDAFGYPELAMDVRTDMDLAEEIFETATPKTDVYRLDAAWSDRFGHPLYVDQGTFVPLYYLRQAGFTGQVVLMAPRFDDYDSMSLLGDLVVQAAARLGRRIAIIASGASLIELAFTQLIINLRYFLMSCALSQKLSPSLPLGHRLGIAYGMTDEIFAVSVSQREPLSPFYSYGLIAVAIPGWVLGTALGAAAGNILPAVLTNALGIAIYGMFIAIILPPAKENRVVAGVVVLSMVLSALFTYLPVLCNISSGFRIIVITLITAGGAALLFPIPDEPAEPEKEMPHEG